MSARRVAFAGAGSIQFAPMLLSDVVNSVALEDTTLVMHDIDAARLDLTHKLALAMLPHAKSRGLKIEATLDPEAAFRNVSAVIISVELDRFDTWERDRDVPARLGVQQALGENGGPGGLFHAMRMIPGVVEIAERVARLSPNALVLNLTNPLSRICQGIANRTRAKFVGLCHEIHGGRQVLSRMFNIPETDLRVRAAGTNHFTWFTDIRDAAGNDLYPRLRDTLTRDKFAAVKSDRLLISEIFRVTGTYCVTNDSHAGEYFRYGHRWWCQWTPEAVPHPFYEKYKAYVQAIEARVREVVGGKRPVAELMAKPSGEEVVPIIERVLRGEAWYSDAINIPNRTAAIPQLPPWAIVEVPGRIDAAGGHGSQVPDLPRWTIAECHRQCMIHDLTVDAAMDGNRQAAIEALMIDSAVPDPATAERVFDSLFAVHRKYLTRWA